MKTKILLSSIGAVVILILVSYTTVIGQQSQPKQSVDKSPLFEYRTKNAIHEPFIACQYNPIRINTILNIPLSAPDQRAQFILRFIQIIVQMDDTTFDTLLAYCVSQLNHNKNVKQTNIPEIIAGLKSIRKNPQYIIDEITNTSNKVNHNNNGLQQYTINGEWIPGCLLAAMFYMVFIYPVLLAIGTIFIIISSYYDCFYSVSTGCDACPCYMVPANRYLRELDKI